MFAGGPGALAASQACYVTDRWYTPHFSVFARFRIDAWMADVACPVACQPIWPACWLDTPDRSSSSSSRIVQDVWDIYRDVLGVVPDDVVLALGDAVSRSAVDDFWSIWSKNAEAGLFRAYALAGGPTAAGSSAFLGRGLLRIRNRRLGGRAAGGRSSSRLYRVSQGDDVDVHCTQYFVHSSLSPVLLFRRRLKSVADVLKGIKGKGFTQSRWDALLMRWGAVCRYGPCGPISSLHPWDNWVPPDLHGFHRWVFDSLEVLNGFVRQVVISRRDEGIRRWNRWLREDLSSRPYAWLAEAQVVCVGQPMVIAGDLNADPAVIPCLAKGMSAGRYIDLALAHSLGAGLTPDITCTFNRNDGPGSRLDFFVECPGALAASQACYVTDWWFTPHFSVFARFRIGAWMADVACPVACQPIWPVCWLYTPDRSSSSSSRIVLDVWDVYRDELGMVPEEVVLALWGAVSRSSVDDFWSIWSCHAEAGLFRAYSRVGGPTEAGSCAFLGRGLLRIRAGVWEAELLVVRLQAGCIGLAMVMKLMCIALSTLFIPPFLLYYSFVGVSSLSLMF